MPYIFDGKEAIMKFLTEKFDKEFTFSELAEAFGVTVPTISKYAQILEAEGKITIRNIGSARLAKLKVVVNGNGL